MNQRGLSTALGAILLVAIAVLLVVTAGTLALGLSNDALGSAAVHSQGQYDVTITNKAEETLLVQAAQFQQGSPETTFTVRINDREVHQWDGKSTLEMECLYPGDTITVRSSAGDTTFPVEEQAVEQPTNCDRYNTFRKKFQFGVIEGQSKTIREPYDFGLALEPNGDSTADDSNGGQDMNLGPISLTNDWHHIERFDKNIEGVEPPVFLIVMVDNVHWEDVPDPGLDPVPSDQYYNWTDSPPDGLDPGADSFSVTGNDVEPINEDSTEPTNDIYVLFKPGCDQSKVVFIEESAGYDNRIYQSGEVIIENTNDAATGETFEAPGLHCPEGLTWGD